ncbi:MAG: hypothetical protein IJ460_00900 [Clostridia bacterium]|nr:hypothetical protein [Clostridia bacterium]
MKTGTFRDCEFLIQGLKIHYKKSIFGDFYSEEIMLLQIYVNRFYAVIYEKKYVDNSLFPHSFIIKNVDKNVDMLIKSPVCAVLD